MDKPLLSHIQAAWILVVFLTITCAIFVYLYNIELQQNSVYEQSFTSQKLNILSLQEQLASLKAVNEQLAENYVLIEEDKNKTETELQELMDMDWEKKYEAAILENDLLGKEITVLKNQHNIDTTRYKRAHDFLSREYDNLRKSLMAESATNEKHLQTITQLETEIRHNRNRIATLEKTAVKEPAVKPQNTESPAPDQDQATVTSNKSDAYRHIRLQSLRNTLSTRESVIKRKILISVIPTIPDGISGSELLALTDNMQSEDLLAVIQGTYQYINQPLDTEIARALTVRMNESDAATAEVMMFNNENTGN